MTFLTVDALLPRNLAVSLIAYNERKNIMLWKTSWFDLVVKWTISRKRFKGIIYAEKNIGMKKWKYECAWNAQ